MKTGVDSTFGQQDFADSLMTNLATAGVNTAAGYAAQKIGNAYKGENPSLNYATHKLTHGALGAVMGALVAGDKARGAIAGAIGAVASEMIAEAVIDNAQKVFENMVEETAHKGRKLSPEEFTQLYKEHVNVQSAANWGKVGAGLVSLLAEQDVNVSIQTATNAVENNLIPMVIGIGFMAYEAYDFYHTYQTEGEVAALKKLGLTIGTAVVGGVVFKSAFKLGGMAFATAGEALRAYKQAHPVFAAFYDKAAALIARHASKLNPIVDKYKQVDAYLDKKIGQGLGKAKEWVGLKTGPSSSANGPRRIGQTEGPHITTTTKTTTSSNQNIGIKWGKGIQDQGMPWEDYLASQLPSNARLPKNFKTFDFFDRRTGEAISAKTLNTMTPSRLADPQKVYYSLKKNIDAAADFTEHYWNTVRITSKDIQERIIEVAIPKTTNSVNIGQISKAVEYAYSKVIKLNITKVD